MTKRVLITGFEPFLDFKTNPTQIIVERLDKTKIKGGTIIGKVLPVDYSKMENELLEIIEEISPNLIIGTGLAPGRSKLSLEKIAVNYKFSTEPDNNGKIESGSKIDQEMPDGMFSLIDVEGLANILNKLNIPTEVSMTAGTYLCNYAMFVIIREAKKMKIKGGFVHVPADTSLAATLRYKDMPSMDIETMVQGIMTIVQHEMKSTNE
ncbi:MAG: pyrrolidone-carboxylate peptidase [Candidatus Parvarchaeota archaeon]